MQARATVRTYSIKGVARGTTRVPVDRSTRENIIILLASPNYLQYQYAGRSGGRPALLLCWPISCTEQTCIALQRHWDLSLAFI